MKASDYIVSFLIIKRISDVFGYPAVWYGDTFNGFF